MARTRLRGLEIGGIQMAIEVPESFEWRWPAGPMAEFGCLPRDPEVHVGVRVDGLPQGDLGGEQYRIGSWSFEIARRDGGWLLGLECRGQRELLASFDTEFRVGEVVVSQELARCSELPLRSPLAEWIVVHRTLARGGLCLEASVEAREPGIRVRLGVPAVGASTAASWATDSSAIIARHALLLREESQQLRCYRTPWSDASDPCLAAVACVSELVVCERAALAYEERLDPDEAAEMLVMHAVVPLCDEALLDRVLQNARTLGERARIYRVGESGSEPAAIEWRSAPLQSAFARPLASL